MIVGARSHSVNIASATVVPSLIVWALRTKYGIELNEAEVAAVFAASGVPALLSSVMRVISTGPDVVRVWLERRALKSAGEFTPEQLLVIRGLIAREVKRFRDTVAPPDKS